MKTHKVLVKLLLTIEAPNNKNVHDAVDELDGGFVGGDDSVNVVDEQILDCEVITTEENK